MRYRNAFLLAAILPLGFGGAAEAKSTVNSTIPAEPLVPITAPAPALKTGSWTFTYYQEPGETKAASTSTICVNAGNTWNTAGPLIAFVIRGNGGWAQDGGVVNFYGTVGEAIQGSAYNAVGQLTGGDLITGRYTYFNIDQSWPNGTHGSFKAVFNGAVCPL